MKLPEPLRYFLRGPQQDQPAPPASSYLAGVLEDRVSALPEAAAAAERTWAVVGGRGRVPADASLGGVSLAQLGLTLEDLAELADERRAEAGGTAVAKKILSRGPLMANPYAQKLMDQGRVVQNWTQPIPIAPGAPILEVVTNRIARSLVSAKYYLTDGVCGPAVDILAEFPLNRGFEVEAVYAADAFPVWFDPDWVNSDSLVDAFGNSRVSAAVAQWVTAECEQLVQQLNLVYQMIDLQKEAYVHGDGFCHRVDVVKTPNYADDTTQVYPENTIEDIQGLNPTAVWISRDAVGRTDRMVLVGQPGIQLSDLPLETMIHLKHRGSAYTTYGFPQTARVFKELAVKEAYLDAAEAWGKRYALPIRMLKYGVLVRGGENAGPVATATMRAAAEAAIQDYDPSTGHTIVAPFHWTYEYVGADGNGALVVSSEVMEANRRILAGLGVPSAFLMGDWTNYATARIQYSGLMHRLKGVQESLRRILEDEIFLPFCRMRGYVDNDGQPIRVRVRWKRAHLEDDASYMQFIAAIAAIPGVLSKETLRESLGFDNVLEEQRFANERDRNVRIQQQLDEQGLLPDGTPKPEPAPVTPAEKAKAVLRLRRGLARLEAQANATLHAGHQLALAARDDWRQYAKVSRATLNRARQYAALRCAYLDRLAVASGTPTTALIALVPDAATAAALAIPGYQPADDLHCTLAILTDVTQETLNRAQGVLARQVQEMPAILASVTGVGRFPATDNSKGREVVYAALDGHDLTGFRASLVESLTDAGLSYAQDFADYTPHLTLAYVPPGADTPAHSVVAQDVAFSRLVLVHETRTHEHQLGATLAEAA